MLKWVSSSRVNLKKTSDKKASTLPSPTKNGGPRDVLEMQLIGNDNLKRNNGTSSRDNCSLFGMLPDSDDNFGEDIIADMKELTICSSRKTNLRCLQLRDLIMKEERLRDGADRLLGIISDAKVRIRILCELNLINTKLQSLREQHSEQAAPTNHTTGENVISKRCHRLLMLSPELKEMKVTNCFKSLKNYLRSHYYEDPENFHEELYKLNVMRKKCLGTHLDEEGLKTLSHYFNQLFFIERRFFPDDASATSVLFEWYDSFSGMKCSQSTVSFEKGCLLFNIGALYAKIAIKQRKSNITEIGSNAKIEKEYFLRAAGAFRHLRENFTNAPSCDLQWSCTEMLMELMVLQQHEVIVEDEFATNLDVEINPNPDFFIKLAQYASFLSESYSKISSRLSVLTSVSRFWCDLVDSKQFYYDSLSHYYTAKICKQLILLEKDKTDVDYYLNEMYFTSVTNTPANLLRLAKSHLRLCISSVESALKVSKKDIKLQFAVQQPFRTLLQKASTRSIEIEGFGSPTELLVELKDLPAILAQPENDLKPIPLDYSKYKIRDLFKKLGCHNIFSSHHNWTCPRKVVFDCTECQELGFSIRGDRPTIVASVEPSSPASQTSMMVGDFIVALNNADVKWTSHTEVVSLIRSCKGVLAISLITPINKNFVYPDAPVDDMIASNTTINADDISTISNHNHVSKYSVIDSPVSRRSIRSTMSENPLKNSKILSISKSNSLSRTFESSTRKPSLRSRREIINDDNVVVVEKNKM